MHKFYKSRRQFLKEFGLAALGTTAASSVFHLNAMNAAFLNNSSALDDEYKALVCFFQLGGNDSFNMLIPRGTAEYEEYATTRSNLSIAQEEILPIFPATSDGKEYGLHPSFSGVQQLFNSGKLSFLNNVGSMIAPTTKYDFQNGLVPLPLGLFSHSDQIQQWQTASPHLRTPYGWGGELANMMTELNTNENISMNISTAGTNVFQYGQNIVEFSVSPFNGSQGITGYDTNAQGFDQHRTQAIDAMLDLNYSDIYKETYARVLKNARDGSREFQEAIENVEDLNTAFSNNGISQSFNIITKVIQAREALGFKRQIFYVGYGGWDHHDNLLTGQAGKLSIVNNAMAEFAAALEEIGMFDSVTTFTISEFGRTLTSNGNGSDHAWGGNVMAMGGGVNGGNMFGTFPSLEINNPLDVGNGVLIPTTTNDLYFAELALWFGVSPSDLNTLFPNIGNFYDTGSGEAPLGMINY
jgi:uncharacterized protein (DUF1501 family)